MTNLLFIGDIFASVGRGLVARHVPELAVMENIHLVIANGENAAGGFGITPALVDEIFTYGKQASRMEDSHFGASSGSTWRPIERFRRCGEQVSHWPVRDSVRPAA